MLCVGLGQSRVRAGVVGVVGAGGGVCRGRIGGEDGVGSTSPGGVSGALQLLARRLRLLALQLELHLKLLQLGGRGTRAQLAPRRTPHPRQLGQQLWRKTKTPSVRNLGFCFGAKSGPGQPCAADSTSTTSAEQVRLF